MNILALDTCTELCSVALLSDQGLYEKNVMTGRGHSDQVLAMLDDVLQQAKLTIADVDIIAFGRGPGSFTGVRVGVGVAQGIAFAHELPVVGISSLAAIAQHAADKLAVQNLAVAIDARMNEIYCASYQVENGLVTLCGDERVCPVEDFVPSSSEQWLGVGTGWSPYENELTANFANALTGVESDFYPQASAIAKLAQREVEIGQILKAEQAAPVYLRDKVAKKKGQQ